MTNINIVYFDMGNTLINFKDNPKNTFNSSIEQSIDYIEKCYNMKLTYETMKEYYECWQREIRVHQSNNVEADILPLLNCFFSRYGLNFTEEEAIELYRVFYHQTFMNAKLEPYAKEALEKIKSNYKIGIISNMPIYGEVIKDVFKKLEIYSLIDYYLFSYDIKICKPSLEIFRKAIIDNSIAANNSIMIGDSLKNDYIPSGKIGMHPVLYGENDGCNAFNDYRKVMMKVKEYERN